jgi:hypothetical protein
MLPDMSTESPAVTVIDVPLPTPGSVSKKYSARFICCPEAMLSMRMHHTLSVVRILFFIIDFFKLKINFAYAL